MHMYWKHLKVLFWRAQRFYQPVKGGGRIKSKEQGRAQGLAFDSGTGIAGCGKERPGPTWVPRRTAGKGICHSRQHQEAQSREPPGRKLPALWDLWSPFEALTLTKVTSGSILALSFIWGQWPHHGEPQFLHLENGNSNTCPSILFRLNKLIHKYDVKQRKYQSQNDTPFMENEKCCKTRLYDVYKGLCSKI